MYSRTQRTVTPRWPPATIATDRPEAQNAFVELGFGFDQIKGLRQLTPPAKTGGVVVRGGRPGRALPGDGHDRHRGRDRRRARAGVGAALLSGAVD